MELLYTLLMRFVIEQFHVFVLDERAGLGQKLASTTSVCLITICSEHLKTKLTVQSSMIWFVARNVLQETGKD